jgi:hypothetical protein
MPGFKKKIKVRIEVLPDKISSKEVKTNGHGISNRRFEETGVDYS